MLTSVGAAPLSEDKRKEGKVRVTSSDVRLHATAPPRTRSSTPARNVPVRVSCSISLPWCTHTYLLSLCIHRPVPAPPGPFHAPLAQLLYGLPEKSDVIRPEPEILATSLALYIRDSARFVIRLLPDSLRGDSYQASDFLSSRECQSVCLSLFLCCHCSVPDTARSGSRMGAARESRRGQRLGPVRFRRRIATIPAQAACRKLWLSPSPVFSRHA